MTDLHTSGATEALALLEELARQRRTSVLSRYVPYPKQLAFHNAGKVHRERLLMAANQVGKCATVSSHLELPDGTRKTYGELYAEGLPFDVWSWDGEKAVLARAVRPIRKPMESCIRLWFRDGRWLEVAHDHRMLLARGVFSFALPLARCVPALPGSSLESCQSVRVSDVLRWRRKLQGFLGSCLAGCRSRDERLRLLTNSVRAWLRKEAYVRQHSFSLSCAGGFPTIYANIGLSALSRPSSLDAYRRIADRSFELSDRAVCMFSRYTTYCIREAQRLLVEALVRLQSNDGVWRGQSWREALLDPFGGDGNQIIAYEPIESQEVYDFSVPATANYINCGVVHHNTFCGGAECAYHLTGRYPDWWDGKRFEAPTRGWAGSETLKVTRDGCQHMLVGDPKTPEQWGTGLIPLKYLDRTIRQHGVADALDGLTVKHITGQTSSMSFKSYDAGREVWQAATLDWVWFDEEPPTDIYIEGLTRTNATGGIVWTTFTPIKGMSEVVRSFLADERLASVQ